MTIGRTKYVFFADFDDSDSIGGTQRAAMGTIPGSGFDKAPQGNRIDGSTTNNGTVGFKTSAARRRHTSLGVSNRTGGIFRPLSSARAEACGSSLVLLEFLSTFVDCNRDWYDRAGGHKLGTLCPNF
jgi:hypothetical protein